MQLGAEALVLALAVGVAIGLAGVAIQLIAYALVVARRLDALSAAALAMNLLGALGVLVSLTGAFNLSSTAIEGAWALIAAVGLVRALAGRR